MPAADPLLETVDTNLDDNARKEAGKKADDILADDQCCAAARPAAGHRDLEQEGRRSGRRQPDRGHVLEHRTSGACKQ